MNEQLTALMEAHEKATGEHVGYRKANVDFYLLAYQLTPSLVEELERRWLPIESAPKDGTRILMWESYESRVYIAAWLDVNESHHFKSEKPIYRWCIAESQQDEQGGYFSVDTPTHWMPLPAPPEEGK